MKKLKIKITQGNAAAIDAALLAANGKAVEHTLTDYGFIVAVAEEAQRQLDNLLVPRSQQRGAVYRFVSGGKLPSSYKYRAIRTIVELTLNTGGWSLTAVGSYPFLPTEATGGTLTLSAEQDAAAVAAARRRYVVRTAPAQAVAA